MKATDHWQLSNWLLLHEKEPFRHTFATGLRIGSVLPDCNLFTYLRGIRSGQGLYGHNAEITQSKICSLIFDLIKTERSGFLCGLRLGTALHYLADAFTYPHHDYYPGTLADHVTYESSLHHTFTEYLADGCKPTQTAATDFPMYFGDMLALYRQCRKCERNDCRFITQMCSVMFETVLHIKEKEEMLYENSDYNRSVPAIR